MTGIFCASAAVVACVSLCSRIVHVHKCCSVGLTMCSQAWCDSSPTHSTSIRLAEGEMVIGGKMLVYVCVCVDNISLVFVVNATLNFKVKIVRVSAFFCQKKIMQSIAFRWRGSFLEA